MNFQVPQFIEQQPKIIGPLTLRQFFYLASAAALSFVSFYLFSFFLWLVITAILFVSGMALAFVKVNGQELPAILASSFAFVWKPRVYTWQRMVPHTTLDTEAIERLENARKNMGVQEKLKSVALAILTRKSPETAREDAVEQYQTVTFLSGEHKLAKRIDY